MNERPNLLSPTTPLVDTSLQTPSQRVVLLAEDDVILRNLFLYILQSLSYAVLVAADGHEAMKLSLAFHGEIALLLTNMDMPGMGGDQLSELILNDRSGLRILQISGSTAESFVGRNLTIAFLQKPFLPTVLIDKISEVLAAPPGTIRKLTTPVLKRRVRDLRAKPLSKHCPI
jgi:two-component system cell cycle sensor histidine kinase/response regulator CckA